MFSPLHQKNNPIIRDAPVTAGMKNSAEVTFNNVDVGDEYKTLITAITAIIPTNDVTKDAIANR